MKRNNIFWSVLALAVLSAGTWACKSLEENPDFASPETFYKTESDMEAAIAGAYGPMNKVGDDWFNNFYNRCVFDCALGVSGGYEKGPQYYKTGGYVSTDEYIGVYWRHNYDGINRCNVIIDALPKVDAVNIKAEVRTRIAGEAKFLRAYYIYHLYVYFENIPVPNKPTREIGVYFGNATGKQEALDLMKADLMEAERDLPATIDNGGRPSKWAASTLLAKVLLERGEYQAAADKSKDVITNSGATLYDDFDDCFDINHENQGERFFESQCDFAKSPWVNYNNMHAHFTPTDWDGGDPNTLEEGDNVTAAGWGDAWLIGDNTFRADYFTDAADKRIKVTYMDQYRSKNAGGEVVTFDPTATSAFIAPGSTERKYKNSIIQKVIEYKIGGWQNTKKNYVLLRLADAYLAHAEAVANGATGDGVSALNALRTRAGIPTIATATKNDVFGEYMREQAGEGWVFPTARRFGNTAELILKYSGRTVDNNKYRVLPIPAVEIIANLSVKQNKGWE